MKRIIFLLALAQPAWATNWLCVQNTGVTYCGDADSLAQYINGFSFSYTKQLNNGPTETGQVLMDCINAVYKETYGGWIGMSNILTKDYQYMPDTFLCPVQITWKRQAGQ